MLAQRPVMKNVERTPASCSACRIAGVCTPEAPQSKVSAISGRSVLPRVISPAGLVTTGIGVGGIGVGVGGSGVGVGEGTGVGVAGSAPPRLYVSGVGSGSAAPA